MEEDAIRQNKQPISIYFILALFTVPNFLCIQIWLPQQKANTKFVNYSKKLKTTTLLDTHCELSCAA